MKGSADDYMRIYKQKDYLVRMQNDTNTIS